MGFGLGPQFRQHDGGEESKNDCMQGGKREMGKERENRKKRNMGEREKVMEKWLKKREKYWLGIENQDNEER